MSLRGAIDRMCRGCLYDHRAAGTWRAQIELCSAYSCPLWKVRPVRDKSLRGEPYSASLRTEQGRWLTDEGAERLSRDPHTPPNGLISDPVGGFLRPAGTGTGAAGPSPP